MSAWVFAISAAATNIFLLAGAAKADPSLEDVIAAPPSCLLQRGTVRSLDTAAPGHNEMTAPGHNEMPGLQRETEQSSDMASTHADDQAEHPPGIGRTAALDEHGYQQVVSAVKAHKLFERQDMTASDNEDMLMATKEKSDAAALTQADEPGAGTTAVLDEHGYQEVLAEKDAQQMEFFARRLISKMGFRVKDQGGLRGLIAYHNNQSAKQTFKTLQEEIKISGEQHVWVTNLESGASAPLNQNGYGDIVTQDSSREMVEFVRRVVSDLGLKVVDEAGLAGLAKWYSGDEAVQTFADLQGELISASKVKGSWITSAAPCPGTHPSEEVLDEIQNATRWATKNASVSVALNSQDKLLSEEEVDENNVVAASAPC